MRRLALTTCLTIIAALSATGAADAAKRHCGTIRYDGFEARNIRSQGLPRVLSCASVLRIPTAWIRLTGAALPDAAREVEFTALFRDWDCFPTGSFYPGGGAAAINIKCGVWRYHRDGSATIGRSPQVRWQAWNL